MADAKHVAAQLRSLSGGTAEYRVQHKERKSYAHAWDANEWIDPGEQARMWLATEQARGRHLDYEVERHTIYTPLQIWAREAADLLDPPTPPVFVTNPAEGPT